MDQAQEGEGKENTGGIQDLKHTSSDMGKRVPVYPFIRNKDPSQIARPCHLVGRTRLSLSLPCHPLKSPHILHRSGRHVSELMTLAAYTAIKGRGHVPDYTANKAWQIASTSQVAPVSCVLMGESPQDIGSSVCWGLVPLG